MNLVSKWDPRSSCDQSHVIRRGHVTDSLDEKGIQFIIAEMGCTNAKEKKYNTTLTLDRYQCEFDWV